MEQVTTHYKECMQRLLQELEAAFMAVVNNPKLDKKEKNLLTKPLVTKKQILLNTLEALELVDRSKNEQA